MLLLLWLSLLLCLLLGCSDAKKKKNKAPYIPCSLCRKQAFWPYTIEEPMMDIIEHLPAEFVADNYVTSNNRLTCQDLAYSAATGCWNASTCDNLRHLVGNICCQQNDPNDVPHGMPVTPQSALSMCPSDKIKNTTQCYDNVEGTSHTICVHRNGGASSSTCDATVKSDQNNNETTTTCQLCQVGNHGRHVYFYCGEFGERFGLNCQNVQMTWNNLQVCGGQLSVVDDSKTPPPRSSSSSSSSNNSPSFTTLLELKLLWKLFVLFVAFHVVLIVYMFRKCTNPDGNDNTEGNYHQTRRLHEEYQTRQLAQLEMSHVMIPVPTNDNDDVVLSENDHPVFT